MTEELKRILETCEYRFKRKVDTYKMYQWLNNFKKEDQIYALALLNLLEYIDIEDLQVQLQNGLQKVLDCLKPTAKVLIMPYGKLGKSGSLASYLLSHVPLYIDNEDRLTLTNDPTKHEEINFSAVIFIDDFIGSGRTFCKEYNIKTEYKTWLNNHQIENRYVVAGIIMHEGKDYIMKMNRDITAIYAKVKNKAFRTNERSELSFYGDVRQFRNCEEAYERNIRVSNKFKLGYAGSQSLVAFFHGTPNNTLPTIWWERKNWKPIFPRRQGLRMDANREYRDNIKFYTRVLDRYGVNETNEPIRVFDEEQKKLLEFNFQIDYDIIALLKLKLDSYDDYFIMSMLTREEEELELLYNRARRRRLVDASNELTPIAHEFNKQLMKLVKKENFRAPTIENLEAKQTIYVPNKNFKK